MDLLAAIREAGLDEWDFYTTRSIEQAAKKLGEELTNLHMFRSEMAEILALVGRALEGKPLRDPVAPSFEDEIASLKAKIAELEARGK